MWILATDTVLFTAIATFCTLLGVAMAILSHVSTAKNSAEKAQRETHAALLAEERRTERLSRQLQELRLRYGEVEDDAARE